MSTAIVGAATGLAILHNPRTYGESTPGQFDYGWAVRPNAGGLPRVGAAGFGLQATTTAGLAAPPGVLVLSPFADNTSILSVRLLLAPNALIPAGPLPAGGAIPLPIPNTTPVGVTVHLQAFYLDMGAPQGLAASTGLRFVTMP